MTTQDIKKGQRISAGSFMISIGKFSTADVAIFSKHSGDFVSQRMTKRSKKLRKIKRLFKHHLCCDKTFCFGHMTEAQAVEMIAILKK